MASTRSQIQLMYGRLVDWEAVNPILLSGEVACVFDDSTLKPVDLRFGNGTLTFKQLPSLSELVLDSASVYSKEEVDSLISAVELLITELTSTVKVNTENVASNSSEIEAIKTVSIPAITDLIEDDASTNNQLTSLSTVIESIESAIIARFGRILTATASGALFASESALISGPWYYNGEETTPIEKDVAEVSGLDYGYKYTTQWETDTAVVIYTAAQKAALNSGVTAELLEENSTRFTELYTSIASLYSAIDSTSESIKEELKEEIDTKADKTAVYEHSVTLISRGSGYTANTSCTIGGLEGVITSVNSAGGITGVRIFNTNSDATSTETGIEAEGGSSATCTIISTEKTYNLDNVSSYLGELVNAVASTKISKVTSDGAFRVIKDGELVSIYSSDSIKYVDKAFTGTADGSEIAPYTTGTEALADVGATDSCSIIYSTGDYEEDLALRYIENKNFIGYAVGSINNTSLQGIRIYSTSSNIGLRDLTIYEAFEINAPEIYGDNLTLNCAATLSSSGSLYFTHCVFNYNVQVTQGTVEFDSCTFSNSAKLTVTGSAKVIVREGVNVTPTVGDGSTYVQYSGSIAPLSSGTYALTAYADASFIGLFNGAAVTSSNQYAPISVASGCNLALGSFIFNEDSSVLPDNSYRISGDGLSGNQVIISTKQASTDGYTTDSVYLSDHLDAISESLYKLAEKITSLETDDDDNTVVNGLDELRLESGSTNGTLVVSAYLNGSLIAKSDEAYVKGLGSAAFTDTTAYATAAQGELATTAYQKPSSGIPSTDLDSTLQTTLSKAELTSNRIVAITSESTDEQYPTGKAVYDYAESLHAAITSEIATSAKETLSTVDSNYVTYTALTNALEDYATGTRLLTADAAGSNFASLSVLLAATTFYYGGEAITSDNLLSGDKVYFEGSDEEGVDTTYQAEYSGAGWVVTASSTTFSSAQQNAMNSGITAALVAALGDITYLTEEDTTVADAIASIQSELASLEATVSTNYETLTGLITTAQNTANSAQTTADSAEAAVATAQTAAANAQTTATSAQTIASSAASIASAAQSTADKALAGLDDKQDILTFDTTPTSGSTNPVTSDGIRSAIDSASGTITVDDALDTSSTNPVQNKVITTKLNSVSDIADEAHSWSYVIQALLAEGTEGDIVAYGGSNHALGSYSFETGTDVTSITGNASTVANTALLTDLYQTVGDDIEAALSDYIPYPELGSLTTGVSYGLIYNGTSYTWGKITSSDGGGSCGCPDLPSVSAGTYYALYCNTSGEFGWNTPAVLDPSYISYTIANSASSSSYTYNLVSNKVVYGASSADKYFSSVADTYTADGSGTANEVNNFNYYTSRTLLTGADEFALPVCYQAITLKSLTMRYSTYAFSLSQLDSDTTYTYSFENSTLYINANRTSSLSNLTMSFFGCKVYIYIGALNSGNIGTINLYDSELYVIEGVYSAPAMTLEGVGGHSKIEYYARVSRDSGWLTVSGGILPETRLVYKNSASDFTTALFADDDYVPTYIVAYDGSITQSIDMQSDELVISTLTVTGSADIDDGDVA